MTATVEGSSVGSGTFTAGAGKWTSFFPDGKVLRRGHLRQEPAARQMALLPPERRAGRRGPFREGSARRQLEVLPGQREADSCSRQASSRAARSSGPGRTTVSKQEARGHDRGGRGRRLERRHRVPARRGGAGQATAFATRSTRTARRANYSRVDSIVRGKGSPVHLDQGRLRPGPTGLRRARAAHRPDAPGRSRRCARRTPPSCAEPRTAHKRKTRRPWPTRSSTTTATRTS